MLHRQFTRTAIAAGLLAASAACTTVGPDYHVPAKAVINRSDAAKNFAGAESEIYRSSPLPQHWWRLYRDETLDRLIEKAFVANTDLRIAAANLERMHGVLEEVEDLRRPEVGAKVATVYGRPSFNAIGLPGQMPNTWLHDIGGEVSYQIDLFGKIKRAIEATEADTEAAEAAYDVTRVTVAAETARAYVEACAAGQQIRVAQHSIDVQKQFVDLTAKRVRVGRGTALDNSRVRGQLEQLRAALPPLEAQRRTAQYRLAVLTGEVPSKLDNEVSQCSTPPRLSSPIPVGDGAALLRRRPDIRQAERNLASATARIGVATAELYPSINLGLSGGSSGVLSALGSGNAFRWALGPLISWTLPFTGPARAHIAQAEAGSKEALAYFDGTVLKALRETESALTVYARELDRNAALRAAREQSALASEQANTLYRYGRTDFLTTLDAERTLDAADSALAASDAQLAINQVTLFLALGGGWEETEEASAHKEPAGKHGGEQGGKHGGSEHGGEQGAKHGSSEH